MKSFYHTKKEPTNASTLYRYDCSTFPVGVAFSKDNNEVVCIRASVELDGQLKCCVNVKGKVTRMDPPGRLIKRSSQNGIMWNNHMDILGLREDLLYGEMNMEEKGRHWLHAALRNTDARRCMTENISRKTLMQLYPFHADFNQCTNAEEVDLLWNSRAFQAIKRY